MADNINRLWIGTCKYTGKKQYVSRKLARKGRRASVNMSSEKISDWDIYRCQWCPYYHIGHNRYREHDE